MIPDNGIDTARLRGHLEHELRAAATYRAMADEVQGEPRAVLLRLAEGEERHARHWQHLLWAAEPETDDAFDAALSRHARRLRPRLFAWLLRHGGMLPLLALLERRESAEIERYGGEPYAPAELIEDERMHAELLNTLSPGWRARAAGTLRAGVFGMSDGVVSNLALVMGVVGAGVGQVGVVIAGVAGLLAGALSMGVGEFVSVASQREIVSGGVDRADPDDAVGSPARAGLASLAAFALGAAVPLVPFLLAVGVAATVGAVLLSSLALYALGASITVLTAQPVWRSGGRQLVLGLAAAAITFVIGQMLGVATA